ncbi:SGNH/GDSL hydrolase family protein [Rhodococcus sp. NPDC059234]|uniref:SGNH/GDSL hydrolase family protein n=1 Tax=Rhodococcus sp. NPDC059234 TaxID=3346781 RepID=UPI003672C283
MRLKAGVRRFVATAAALAAVTGVASGATASASAPADHAPGLEYVNLGDSFSAGSGVFPIVPDQEPKCWQSQRDFSHVVAAQLGYRLTDVSCGGATTEDFYGAQHDGMRPQLEALTPTTELVSLMIGGNNNGTFAGAMATCIRAMATHPGAFEPCRAQYGTSLTDPIVDKTYPALVTALRDIHAKSPRAHVVIVGYPWVLPASGGCFPQMPVAEGDVRYLRDMQAMLNDAVERAAAETGSTFVDMSQVSDGHDACKPVGQRWVEPMLNTTQPIPVHPNADGERALADRVIAAIGR